jgi:predicted nuclease of predicted toxin-antitoxin system
MKLLFDENLSPRLGALLAAQYPGSLHVRDCGLKGAPDQQIWDYARLNDFILVSKDSDFYQRSLFYGSPPKFVWLRLGNCTRDDLINLLTLHASEVQALAIDPSESVLVLA